MKRNIITILAAALLIAAGLLRGYTPGLPSEVYNAEVITEAPEPQEFDTDKPEPDEPGLDELESGETAPEPEPDEPASGEAIPEPEPNELEPSEPDTGLDVSEVETGVEEVSAPPAVDGEIGLQGTLPDAAGMPPAVEDVSEADLESNPEESEPENEAEALETSETADEFAVGFAAVAAGEAVVKTYAELHDALADDNGITTVYFGADITMLDGIKINANKATVTIDGFNPLESGQTQPYTLIELDSATFHDAIYVEDVGTHSIHVRDLTIIGKNYFGPFSVFDKSGLAGFVITYERVNYDGPQLGYNRRGTVRLIDCSASIHGGNGAWSPGQEFSEVKHLSFEGKNSIETASSAYSVFWHPFGGTFTLADDASLTLISPSTSIAYGVFFADSYLNDITLSIGSRAVFAMTISGLVAPEPYSTIRGLTVQEGGTFHLKTTASSTAAVLRMGGPLIVEKDARFIIAGYGGNAYVVLRQESGDITVGKDAIFQITADNPYTSLLNLVGRAFICNDPLSVLLINARRDIQASLSAGHVSVNAQQINYWNTLSPGGLDHPPLYKWTKTDQSNVTVDGTLSYYGSTDFSNVTSNHVPADPPGVSPSTTTFSMVASRVLAFGRLSLIVAGPTAHSNAISGVTEAGAVVRASFSQQGVDYTLPDVVADSEGAFHIPAGTGLQAGTVIKVEAAWQYLTAEAEVTVSDEGRLVLFVPNVLEFYTTQLSTSEKTVTRVNPEWKIVVSDTRGGGSRWDLYARLDGKMTPASADFPALEDALVFVDQAGKPETMYPDDDVLIARHTPTSGEDVFSVIWDDNKGMLLTVKPGAAFSETVYTASIAWTIVDGV